MTGVCGRGEGRFGPWILHQARDVSPIDAIQKGQQLTGAVQFEVGVFGEEFSHDFAVFLGLEAAGAVNQRAAWLQEGGGLAQQVLLSRAQPRELFRANPLTQIHPPPHDAGVGAWGVNQDTVTGGRN